MHRGFTIIELIVALSVAALLLSFAYPPFNDMLERLRSTARVNAVIGLVRFARQTAVTQRRWITLCPAVGERCTGSRDWHTGVMAFADLNRDGDRQPEEPVVGHLSAFKPGERLIWRSFRNRQFLQFRSAGYTNWQNGSFQYCPASGDSGNGRVIIVNIQGRATPSIDADGDGVVEQANGRPLAC